jgi:hypothetical protein
MLTDRQLALAAEWLLPAWESPWQWDAEGEAIHWTDGTTIVFREELRLIVERCANRGLPPSGPLILLLAGCRGGIRRLPQKEWDAIFCENNAHDVVPTINRLKRLEDLPAKIVGGVAGRAALVHHIFAEVPPVRDEQTAAVLTFFRAELPIRALGRPAWQEHGDSLFTSLLTLNWPLEKLAPQILALLRETGLEALPEAAEIELPETPDLGRLFAEMEDDPELSPILRITRDVMAAVSLPEALAAPDEESLGGVSDIGNRGPLHRLLLSELAHDDDTLAIRIALNEALYLRREPASRQPPGTLALLLDTGVRMWGIPRVFAVSTALAFLAKAPKHALPAIFRSEGNAVAPVELRTRAGVIAQLAALDSALHAGPSLASLARSLADSEGQLDLVIVTHAATADDREFLEALAHFPDANIFVAALDREGRLAVRKRTAHGWRTLTEARIDLSALSAPRPRLRSPLGSLPAILGVQPFPFLLSPFGHFTRRCALRGDRRAFLTDSGEVWIFTDPRRGGRRLLAEPVAGTVLFLGPDRATGLLGAVAWRSNEGILEMRSEERGFGRMSVVQRREVRVCPLKVDLRGGVLFLVFGGHAEAVDFATGVTLGVVMLSPRMHAIGARYLLVPESSSTQLVLVFDREGRETPWALHQDGRLFPLDELGGAKLRLKVEGTIRKAEASHRGDRIWGWDHMDKQYMADLTANNALTPCRNFITDKEMLENVAAPQRWSLRVRFTHAGFDPRGSVILRSQKDYWTWIALAASGDAFQFQRLSGEEALVLLTSHRGISFRPLATPSDLHLSLQVAEWPDGSRAFLDGRGMLHLQSSDPAVPEITFVLAESASLPAWSSEGHIVGPAHFLGDRKPTDHAAATIASHLRRFVSHLS